MDHRSDVHKWSTVARLQELPKRLAAGSFTKDVLMELYRKAQRPEEWTWLRQAAESLLK